MRVFKDRLRLARSIGWIGLLILAGCAGRVHDGEVLQYFDESSGATVTRLAAPVAFYNEEPMLAANARDYVYVGPVELNRSGRREIILWMNFCSTIDRGRRPDAYRPDRVFLMLDGKPMDLAESGSRMSAAGWSYVSPVVGGWAKTYRITRAQLRSLAKAGDVRLLADENGVVREYAHWGSADTGFGQFAGYIEDESRYLVTSVDE
jgi:hypothetical protein